FTLPRELHQIRSYWIGQPPLTLSCNLRGVLAFTGWKRGRAVPTILTPGPPRLRRHCAEMPPPPTRRAPQRQIDVRRDEVSPMQTVAAGRKAASYEHCPCPA